MFVWFSLISPRLSYEFKNKTKRHDTLKKGTKKKSVQLFKELTSFQKIYAIGKQVQMYQYCACLVVKLLSDEPEWDSKHYICCFYCATWRTSTACSNAAGKVREEGGGVVEVTKYINDEYLIIYHPNVQISRSFTID